MKYYVYISRFGSQRPYNLLRIDRDNKGCYLDVGLDARLFHVNLPGLIPVSPKAAVKLYKLWGFKPWEATTTSIT